MKKILINKTSGNWKNEIMDVLVHVYNNPVHPGLPYNNCSITFERENEEIKYVLGLGPIDRNLPDITIDSNLKADVQTLEQGTSPVQHRAQSNLLSTDKIYLNCPDDHEY
jgi:hypothetical protein